MLEGTTGTVVVAEDKIAGWDRTLGELSDEHGVVVINGDEHRLELQPPEKWPTQSLINQDPNMLPLVLQSREQKIIGNSYEKIMRLFLGPEKASLATLLAKHDLGTKPPQIITRFAKNPSHMSKLKAKRVQFLTSKQAQMREKASRSTVMLGQLATQTFYQPSVNNAPPIAQAPDRVGSTYRQSI